MDETHLSLGTPSHPALAQWTHMDPANAGSFVRLRQVAGRIAESVRRLGSRLLAATRLSREAVCRESATLGVYDYHTHHDDPADTPWFVQGGRRCGRCGKRFRI
jgi:hypothetical protein